MQSENHCVIPPWFRPLMQSLARQSLGDVLHSSEWTPAMYFMIHDCTIRQVKHSSVNDMRHCLSLPQVYGSTIILQWNNRMQRHEQMSDMIAKRHFLGAMEQSTLAKLAHYLKDDSTRQQAMLTSITLPARQTNNRLLEHTTLAPDVHGEPIVQQQQQQQLHQRQQVQRMRWRQR